MKNWLENLPILKILTKELSFDMNPDDMFENIMVNFFQNIYVKNNSFETTSKFVQKYFDTLGFTSKKKSFKKKRISFNKTLQVQHFLLTRRYIVWKDSNFIYQCKFKSNFNYTIEVYHSNYLRCKFEIQFHKKTNKTSRIEICAKELFLKCSFQIKYASKFKLDNNNYEVYDIKLLNNLKYYNLTINDKKWVYCQKDIGYNLILNYSLASNIYSKYQKTSKKKEFHKLHDNNFEEFFFRTQLGRFLISFLRKKLENSIFHIYFEDFIDEESNIDFNFQLLNTSEKIRNNPNLFPSILQNNFIVLISIENIDYYQIKAIEMEFLELIKIFPARCVYGNHFVFFSEKN